VGRILFDYGAGKSKINKTTFDLKRFTGVGKGESEGKLRNRTLACCSQIVGFIFLPPSDSEVFTLG